METSIAPREVSNVQYLAEVNEAPAAVNGPPVPSGRIGGFQPHSYAEAGSLLDQVNKFIGQSASGPEAIAAADSTFTRNELEFKNQDRVRAFLTGPVFPTGNVTNSFAAHTLMNANRERLNSGTPVVPAMAGWRVTALGNHWQGTTAHATNWAEVAAAVRDTANTDLNGGAGYGTDTGRINLTVQNEFQPQLSQTPGGFGALLNLGSANAGGGFTKVDGAAGGDAARAALPQATNVFAIDPPSGAGSLAVPKAYGLSALL